MESITVEEFQNNFDEFFQKVEGGESLVIRNENGDVIIQPLENYKDSGPGISIFCDHNDGC